MINKKKNRESLKKLKTSEYCKTGYFSGHVIFAVNIQSAKINDRGKKGKIGNRKYVTVKEQN